MFLNACVYIGLFLLVQPSWSAATPSSNNATNKQYKNATLDYSSGVEISYFLRVNLAYLAKDIARGNGAYLHALAELFGIAPSNRAHFGRVLQQNYGAIFSRTMIKPQPWVNRITTILSDHHLSVRPTK